MRQIFSWLFSRWRKISVLGDVSCEGLVSVEREVRMALWATDWMLLSEESWEFFVMTCRERFEEEGQ